ncbi:CPA_1a_G0028100.mRNA.1.CDS.1 [Saccharomyces cerevisiae]|nr:CPA_1a_G0028100.mRNA.1.CDS.1 [Saccharomyces cerevisiae]CAI4526154.1 CPI_1c_G0027490.mRNA.1.CDS.1 [Saccharomyces cerevisiae]CAI4537094.1 BBM_1a_G0027670.mRNA.1.CDS.1 [Saccharomyces cerevisiae]CAI7162341.1 BBM_1a_G0027670.mRNA.1.CDS.1 [Saccharomyces cerevisiae]CAI7343339.1 CPI_1c_G0027490.mRNA.1.CDS.1 [Saccharomyces cerevisiae]
MVKIATSLIHSDDPANRVSDVAPPINVTTTFRYDNHNLVPASGVEDFLDSIEQNPVYSRESHPNSSRVQLVLSQLLGGHAVIYNSGCSAFHALMCHYNPKRFFMDGGYFGVQAIANLITRNYGLERHPLKDIEDFAQKGDVVHLETPLNPYGISEDIKALAERVHKKGAILSVDSTLAPPPLQNAWDFGADIVLHSATKYLGGHSDLLAGVLVVKSEEQAKELIEDRIHLGTNIGNLESFLLLRSLRTCEMRVQRQSENAIKIVKILDENKGRFGNVLNRIYHSSLQSEPFVKEQLHGGHGPVFAITLKTVEQCKELPLHLRYFQHATSLGGVESLIEWRAMSDTEVDQCLIRVSVGCENVEDLIADLERGLEHLQNATL